MPQRSRRIPPPRVLSGLEAAVLDAIPISLYVVDRQLRVVGWNRARELGDFGKPRERVLGRSLQRALPPAGFREAERLIQQVFRTGKVHRESRETRPGRRLYEIARYPVFDGRRVSHVLCSFEDLTEKRAIELQLIASDRLAFLGQLVAGVAHEVSNPLAGIAGCAEALASIGLQAPGKPARDQAREFRDLIRGEVARCERIVRTLLDSARPSPGHTADLKTHVGTALRLLERHPAFARVRVISRIPDGLPAALIEPDSLKQVVMALATNAGRAMAAGGVLTIRAGRSRGELFLDVIDTGPGIPRELRNRVFEPFFSTDPAHGTGLGLAIARSLVRGRGGDIVYRARASKGAAFRVVLKPAEGTS
jgi:PAS domain S-box-containing protein